MKFTLCCFFFAYNFTLYAQLPLLHYLRPVKGEVIKAEHVVYKSIEFDSTGKPLLPPHYETRELIIYENGLPIVKNQYITISGNKEILRSRIEYTYENKQVIAVKEFINTSYSKNVSLKLKATFTHNYVNGELESENVLDGKGELLSTIKYRPHVMLGGLPLIQFDEYRFINGKMQKGDSFGIQHDSSGRSRIYFQIHQNDTISYQKSTAISVDTWRLEHNDFSTNGLKEYIWKEHIQYDAIGNPLWIISEDDFRDANVKRFSAAVFRYQYQGDNDWNAAPLKVKQSSKRQSKKRQ